MNALQKHWQRYRFFWLAGTVALIVLVAAFAPAEKTLGASARLVYVHGAWVWAGLIAFACAALAGLTALLARQNACHAWSVALARTGLVFWWTYLPMSLLVMQLNWGGLFLDEPRWKIPFTFGVAGLILQAGLALFNRGWLHSLANLLFGASLWYALGSAANILHPDSPIAGAPVSIRVFFIALMALSVLFGIQLTLLFYRRT